MLRRECWRQTEAAVNWQIGQSAVFQCGGGGPNKVSRQTAPPAFGISVLTQIPKSSRVNLSCRTFAQGRSWPFHLFVAASTQIVLSIHVNSTRPTVPPLKQIGTASSLLDVK